MSAAQAETIRYLHADTFRRGRRRRRSRRRRARKKGQKHFQQWVTGLP